MIKKNFKVLIRSKSSALIILLGPFFIIFLLGIAFNSTGLHSVRVGVYADSYTGVADDLLGELTKNDFIIIKAPSEEQCIAMVSEGGAHLCIKLPSELEGTALSDLDREIIFHVDYSKVNLVFTILSIISHEVDALSSDLSLEYTKSLLEVMNQTATEIEGKVGVIRGLKEGAVGMRSSLQEMRVQLGGLDIDADEFGIGGLSAQLAASQAGLQQFGASGNEAVDSGLQLLDGIESYLSGFETTLDTQVSELHGFESTVGSYTSLVCAVDYSTLSIPFDPCGDLQDIQTFVAGVIEDADTLSSDFDSIEDQIDDVRRTLEGTSEQQDAMIGGAQAQVAGLSQQLSDAETRVGELQGQKEGMVEQLDQLLVMLDDNIVTIDDIELAVQDVAAQIREGRLDSADEIVNPILTRIKPILKRKSYLDYTMPSLVVLIVMFMSILLSTTVVMTEKNSRAYFRNYITPTKKVVFLASTYCTNLLIVLVQALILLFIATFAFNVGSLANLLAILVSLLFICSVFILIGMLIGYLFSSEETGTLASISLASIFLLFSSFLIPLESLSKTVSTIAQYNPFVLSENVLRQLLIFGKGFSFSLDLIILGVYVLVIAVLLYLAQELDRRRFA